MKKRKFIVISIIIAAALMCATGASAWTIDANDSDRVTVPCIVTI